MISQTAEYALRSVVYLAQNSSRSYVAQEIADGTQVPPSYISKVLQSLSKVGILNAQRGLHGGFSIAKDIHHVTIYDVVMAVDPIKRITSCPLQLAEHGTNLCPLHRHMDDAIAQIEKLYKESTIGSLLAERKDGTTPLCPFPIPAHGKRETPSKKKSV
jgi:Rrf2 family protein